MSAPTTHFPSTVLTRKLLNDDLMRLNPVSVTMGHDYRVAILPNGSTWHWDPRFEHWALWSGTAPSGAL